MSIPSPPNCNQPFRSISEPEIKKPNLVSWLPTEFGGQSRNRTTDTRIFKTNHCLESLRESRRILTNFLLAARPLGTNRTSYRTFVAYRSLAGAFVEQHQWDAAAFTDPLPIWQCRLWHARSLAPSGGWLLRFDAQ